ncbi:isopentenyl-diphosphate Delta-isomerase [Thioclava indica]|nr:NUDIX domain-containing protein [Thioclava indica]
MTQIQAWVGDKLMPVDKTEAHARGLRHKAVSIFVMDGDKLLIQKRAAGRDHSAGKWSNTCCSHPDWDERPEHCAVRRLREELGITGLYPAHADRIEYRAEVAEGLIEHEVVEVYLAHVRPGMQITPDPHEVSETRWVGLYDLAAEVRRHPERFSKWLRIYMNEQMGRIFSTLIC